MRSPKESREQLNRINELIEKFEMLKGWVDGEAGYMLYNPENKEKFILDEYDTDQILQALRIAQFKSQREFAKFEEWCKVDVHVDISGLQEKDKGRRAHKKKKRGSGKE